MKKHYEEPLMVIYNDYAFDVIVMSGDGHVNDPWGSEEGVL